MEVVVGEFWRSTCSSDESVYRWANESATRKFDGSAMSCLMYSDAQVGNQSKKIRVDTLKFKWQVFHLLDIGRSLSLI